MTTADPTLTLIEDPTDADAAQVWMDRLSELTRDPWTPWKAMPKSERAPVRAMLQRFGQPAEPFIERVELLGVYARGYFGGWKGFDPSKGVVVALPVMADESWQEQHEDIRAEIHGHVDPIDSESADVALAAFIADRAGTDTDPVGHFETDEQAYAYLAFLYGEPAEAPVIGEPLAGKSAEWIANELHIDLDTAQRIIRQVNAPYRRTYDNLWNIDQLLHTNGVESMSYPDSWGSRFLYANAGDPHTATVLLYDGQLYVNCWADALAALRIIHHLNS